MKLNFDQVKDVVRMWTNRNYTYLELYKNYLLYVMTRQALLEKEKTTWMANIKSPVTFVICSAIYGMYLDNNVTFEVYRQVRKFKGKGIEKGVEDTLPKEVTDKVDQEIAEGKHSYADAILDLLEHIYSEIGADEILDMIALHAIITGNGYGGIEYLKYTDKYEYTTPDGGKKSYTEKEDTPNIYDILPLNFFPSWSTKRGGKEHKYIIVRRIMNKDTFDKVYKFFQVTLKENELKEKGGGEILERKDWDMVIKNLMFNNMPGVTYDRANSNSDTGEYTHNDIENDNSFKIGKDIYEIYEVHTDNTIQIFANGIDHGTFPRQGPWKKMPFFSIKFKNGLSRVNGMGAGYIAYSYQKIIDMFLNLRIDTNKIAASQPLAVSSDETIFDGMDHLNVYPGKLIKLHDPEKGIIPLKTIESGNVANSEVEMVSKMIQEALGLSGYNLGVQQKVERAAKGITELVKSAERGLKEFVKSIGRSMSFASKYMTILAIEYMDKETMIKITGTDILKGLTIENLINDYTVTFDIQPMKTGVDQAATEMIRRFIEDAAEMTRPDGTPLFDQKEGYKLLLEKSGLPPKLLLTEDEAQAYMEKQLENKYKLGEKEKELAEKYGMQSPTAEGQAMPDNGVGNALGGGTGSSITGVSQGNSSSAQKGVPGGIPGMVGGDMGPTENIVQNPEGNN